MILIVDNGSQYTHLIKRNMRDLGKTGEIVQNKKTSLLQVAEKNQIQKNLITVMIRLIRSFHRQIDIIGLLLTQYSQLGPDLLQM